MTDRINSTFLHALQCIYSDIGDRGICIDYPHIQLAKVEVLRRIKIQLAIASDQWNCKVFIGKDTVGKKELNCVNLNATQGERALLKKLKDLGYKVPQITAKNGEGEYEQKYSTGELALQKMLASNQFGIAGGDPAIRAVLKVRELGKILSQYLNARFLSRTPASPDEEELYYFLSTYNVAGTVTGRRSSRKHTFGFGGNAQNFPKHSDVAKIFRNCLVPRPGNIFLTADQCQAEEWPVSALANNKEAIRELETGVDRHSKLASAVFNEHVPGKDDPDWDDAKHFMKRYLGKKIKHARNYGMKAPRMSESLAQEGFSVSIAQCEMLLARAAAADPSVDSVFHEYIKRELEINHCLKTPFGRERIFLGARPNADNNRLFNEAYSYIPQSTVGDNTALTLFQMETQYPKEERCCVQECHDSLCLDVRKDPREILKQLERLKKAFHRKIKFYTGIEVEIPIEAEIGSSFGTSVEFKDMSEAGLKRALEELEEKKEKNRLKELQSAA